MYCSFTFKIFVCTCSFFISVRIQIFTAEMASPLTLVNPISNHGEKPERFNGTDFKR